MNNLLLLLVFLLLLLVVVGCCWLLLVVGCCWLLLVVVGCCFVRLVLLKEKAFPNVSSFLLSPATQQSSDSGNLVFHFREFVPVKNEHHLQGLHLTHVSYLGQYPLSVSLSFGVVFMGPLS